MSLEKQLIAAVNFSIAQMERETLAPRTDSRPHGLTERELQILALMAEGDTNSAIAAKMFLSPGTVRNYVSTILMKMDAPNRAAASALYTQGTKG